MKALGALSLGLGTVLLVAACGGNVDDDKQSSTQRLGATRIVTALGTAQVDGHDALVEVVARVSAGPEGLVQAERALEALGATPIAESIEQGTGYTYTGLEWPSFPVVLQYNAADAPVSESAVTNAQDTWTQVTSSSASLASGASTSKCPSLVAECRGPQKWNGANEVAWLRISDPNTLGVTWSGDGVYGPEADVGMNTRFAWSETLPPGSGEIDAQTVFLHEFGHVLGLGHSSALGAVMEPVYAGPRRVLSADDINGISLLYGPCTADAECDDGNACTNDSCSAGECVNANNTSACDDGDTCTVDDICTAGACVGTQSTALECINGGGSGADCGGSKASCDSNADCCSGNCKGGVCRGG